MSDDLEFNGEAILEEVPVETVDGLPALADVRVIEHSRTVALPAVRTAAVAVTGFVAGAATFAVVRRHQHRKLVQPQPGQPSRPLAMLPSAGSRTYLVNVRVIGKPPE